ncbi:MAG TPA: PorP/SprF family type IX secretion system membrane protein [Saprospiraceae bacterium]|nr:PorP/SprF family type IX secretion system membrane protein [Saprospiraceae bacterium]
MQAQDQQFTQFYAAPLTLNPALTGAFEGKYRVASIYRDQWKQVLDAPLRTYALAADLRFAPGKRKVKEDAVGVGLLFNTDRAGLVEFSTTQIAVSAAYHKSLGVNNRQYLTLGLQGGLTQRSVSYALLRFHDQFDGVSGYTFATQESLPENNFSFSDVNVGLNYTAQVGRNGRIYTGAAFHHFNQPRVAFFKDANGKGVKLYSRYSAQVAANIPVTRDMRVSLMPRLLVASQGPHLQVNAGSNVRMTMGRYGGSALHLGGWVRPVRNLDGMGLDAVVALAGIEFNNVLIGLSYDLNLKALGANQRQGAFEVSIAYLGSYDNEEILCPKF